MAKKKSAKPVSAKSAPTSSPKPKAAKAKPAMRPFTDEHIGLVAGEIWHLLSADGSQSLSAVKKSIEASSDLVTASVGWLAREGKLEFAKSGRSVKLTLR